MLCTVCFTPLLAGYLKCILIACYYNRIASELRPVEFDIVLYGVYAMIRDHLHLYVGLLVLLLPSLEVQSY